MAWVSPKVFAILSASEEGKDIIEKLPDMTQEEASAEIDAFFGEGGKGASSGEEYSQAKSDYEQEEEHYKAIGDEEVSEKDYEQEDAEQENEQLEVEDWQISEALDDNSWGITQETTVGQYAQEIAVKLGIPKGRVLGVMDKENNAKLNEDDKLAPIIFGETD